MRKRITAIATLLVIQCTLCIGMAMASIGTWKVYMAYNDVTVIRPAGSVIYALGSGALFSYNVNDQSVTAYDKVNRLSDNSIKFIKWNDSAKRLLIVYENHNIDLLDNNGSVTNISDYYNKSLTVDKTINAVTISGVYAYLSTAFGILKLDMRKAEISDTYNLGMMVQNCAVSDSRIYAQTAGGIYSANTNDNLTDKSNWTRDYTAVGSTLFKADDDMELTTKHGYNEYRIYDTKNKCWWSNQEDGCMQSYTEDTAGQQTITRRNIMADGPKYNHFGFMTTHQGVLYTCGSYSWTKNYDATIQVLDNGMWNIYQSEGIKGQTGVTFTDMMAVAVDPMDPKHVVGGSRNGVYEFYDGQFVKFHNSVSTGGLIGTAIKNNKEYELITAACFDRDGYFWCFNSRSYTEKPLLRLDPNGNWTAYGDQQLLTYKGRSAAFIKSLIQDSNGNLWFGTNEYEGTALYMYDISNDIIYTYNDFTNQDNTDVAAATVSSVAEDKDGNIWVGTNKGPLMLTAAQVTTPDPSGGFTQVKIPRNDNTNYADYLLSGVDVSCIAIDGANRKWIGTNGTGVYMISSDNMEELYHFTTDNSKLLSDNIESMAINDLTGEVFFGTDKGLCSYMSDATESNEDMTESNVYAYPNPVTPEYTGLITVVGLSADADVKVLTANGAVVAEGRSKGGMFTWDGNGKDGKRVASGVYMVATAKSDGSKGTVCKIAIIN